MREVQINVWCDRCEKNNHRTAAALSTGLAIGDDPPRTLDLCDECAARLLEYQDLARTHGATPEAPTRQRKATAALNVKHSRAYHGPPLTRYEGPRHYATDAARHSQYAIECPVCPSIVANRSILSHHTRDVHGVGIHALTKMGLLPPASEAPYPPTPAERASTQEDT